MVKDVVIESNCDIFCFQETKWSDRSIFRMRQVAPPKFNDYQTLDANGLRGGILLAWSSIFSSTRSFIYDYSVTFLMSRGSFNFMLTCVYGPQDDALKRDFLK